MWEERTGELTGWVVSLASSIELELAAPPLRGAARTGEAVQEVCVSASIVAHRRIHKRTSRTSTRTRSRTVALVERDIHAIRTRVYAYAALRRYFLDAQRAALADRLERLMVAMGWAGRIQ